MGKWKQSHIFHKSQYILYLTSQDWILALLVTFFSLLQFYMANNMISIPAWQVMCINKITKYILLIYIYINIYVYTKIKILFLILINILLTYGNTSLKSNLNFLLHSSKMTRFLHIWLFLLPKIHWYWTGKTDN